MPHWIEGLSYLFAMYCMGAALHYRRGEELLRKAREAFEEMETPPNARAVLAAQRYRRSAWIWIIPWMIRVHDSWQVLCENSRREKAEQKRIEELAKR